VASSGVEMKRVLFLALLIVSIVEFTMERDRLYLLSTIVALLALVYSLFHERDLIRVAPKVDRNTARKAAGKIVG
jgi:hypothetical protein